MRPSRSVKKKPTAIVLRPPVYGGTELHVIRHPSRFFIRFLLSQGEGASYGPEYVNRHLDDFGLLPVTAASVKQEAILVHSADNRPRPYLPGNRHAKNRLFWRSLEIEDMQMQTPEVMEATRLLHNMGLRQQLETGLLGRVSCKKLHTVLWEKHGREQGEEEPVSLEAIEHYAHYYFNPNAMTVQEWIALYADRGGQLDQRVAIARGGVEMALHRLGLRAKMDSQVMMGNIKQEVYFRFMEVSQLPTHPETVRMLTALSGEFRNLDESSRGVGGELASVTERYGRFALETDSAEVPSLDELAHGGTHSLSGAKK